MKANQLLRREREIHGWSQARVASELGIDPATVGRWERGLSFPYPYFREKLCILFGKNAQELGLLQDDEDSVAEEQSSSRTIVIQHATSFSPLYDPAVPLSSTIGSGLVGRDDLLRQLKQRLCAGGSVALTALNGLPGVGKTALAIQLVHDDDVLAYFCDGILWVGLGPHPHVQGQLSRWGALLGVASSELVNKSNEIWGEAIRSAIGMRRLLLVIDDAWAIEDAQAFKIGGPNCAYLVTTRLPQIALYFAGDGATVVHELSEDDSIALLMRLVPAIVAHEATTVHQLVRSVGGLPLALNLMGKYLRVQSHSQQPRRIKAAVERLRDARERLQVSEPYALVERHSSLQPDAPLSLKSVIAVSEQMLNEQARSALRALAIFPAKPNSFSEEAAAAVCDQPLETIDILSDIGVLESKEPGRYTLHQTIADYALVYLDDLSAYKRFVEYFVNYIETHEHDYHALDEERDNILRALQIANERDMQAELVRGVSTFSTFLQSRAENADPLFS